MEQIAKTVEAAFRTRARENPLASAIAGAAAAWALGLVAALLLRSLLPPGAMLLLFVPALIVGADLGGGVVGAGALALGVAALWPLVGFGAELVVFVLVGALIVWTGESALRRRRRGDHALRVLAGREAQLRSIFDTAPDAMIVIDKRGVVQSYSEAARRMFGWTAPEVLGRNISMLMPSPYRDQHDDYIKRYLVTGQRRIIGVGRIVVGERKDGSTFPLELNVGEVRSDQGRFFTGFIRDLTERQETEARLQELQSELVHISRLSAMGEMASALAHELNQPLSAIVNYLGASRRLIEHGGNSERTLEAVQKASEQAMRAGDIIRRLRDFLARGENERSVESLSRLVQEACTLALVGAKEFGVRMQYSLDPRVERVVVDRIQVQQVIVNLVRNALDAMFEHEGRREIRVATAPADDDMAMISVADTGPGLDSSAAARLFEPFVTTKAHGMGVGLSISRSIVESHGGRIWHEPNPNGGATFSFTVRSARAEDDETQS